MTELQSSKSARASGGRTPIGRLFVLDLSGNRVLSLNPDGSDRKVVATECRLPDGIAVDVEGGHIYWTNMGVLTQNDGSIERVDLDGRNRTTIVPPGGTFTPKQLPARKEERQAVLVRPGGHARHARQPRRVGAGNPRGDEPGRPATGPRSRRSGASALPSMPGADRSTGRKKALTMPARAAFSAPASKFPRARLRPVERTSKFFTTGLPSRSIWSSISRIASCTGPTGAIRRAATR